MHNQSSLTVLQALTLLERREISAEELTTKYLRQSHQYNPTLHAYIHIDEAALVRAREIDRRRATGESLGRLAGVPIAMKDLIDTKLLPTTYGGRHYKNHYPQHSAFVVERLEAEGAIIIGKTNLHEYAYGVTNENPHFGTARNPWNPKHVTGGSSGGNSSALMAGLAVGAVGTDTGGSIRIPAALCGHVGLKPTYGRVSRSGVFPLSPTLDHVGPMTKTARDAALFLDVMAGHDRADDSSSTRPVPALTDLGSLGEIRIGVPSNFFFETCNPEISAAIQKRIDELPGPKKVIPIFIPMMDELPQMQNIIISSEARHVHEELLHTEEELYGEDVLSRLKLADDVRGYEYVQALDYRKRFIQQMTDVFLNVDVIITPTTPIFAPTIGQSTITIEGEELPVRPQLTRYTNPWNFSGLPAITIPCGVGENGLPIGMQIVACQFGEAKLLQVAYAFEDMFQFPTIAPRYSPT